MKATTCILAAALLGGCLDSPALAISTLDDTLRDLPRISRTPSTYPPNNALRRNLTGGGENGNGRSEENRDAGPDANSSPTTVTGESFPFTAALSESPDLGRDFVCAGALIAPAWVLTAAHCTYNIARRWPAETSAFVFTGTGSLGAPGRRFGITQIVIHPQYDVRTLKNDIALVKIDARGNAAGPPIRIEGPRAAAQTGEIASILGWGITTGRFDQARHENLQILQATVLDDGVCFSTSNFPALRTTGVFCARSLLKHHDVCFRFGGSPIVLYNDAGQLYLMGLVSWPATCPTEGRKPNIHLDVQAYVPWIKSVIDAQR